MLSNTVIPPKSACKGNLLIILMSLCSSLWVITGYAASEVSVTEGIAHLEVQQANGSWEKAGSEELELPAVVRTLNTGRSKISQGKTSITLNPNTELSLAASSSRAKKLISLIKQRVGSAIYKVEKHPGDFTVETPYLVSVVKGTRFSVVTDKRDSLVTVTEGLVEVRDLRSGESNMVRPGEIIRSARSDITQATRQNVTRKLSEQSTRATSSTENAREPGSLNTSNTSLKATNSNQSLIVDNSAQEDNSSLSATSAPIKISTDSLTGEDPLRAKRNPESRPDSSIDTRPEDTFEVTRSDIDYEAKNEIIETAYEQKLVKNNEQRLEANEQKARDTNSFEDSIKNSDPEPSNDQLDSFLPNDRTDVLDDSIAENDATSPEDILDILEPDNNGGGRNDGINDSLNENIGSDLGDTSVETLEPETINPETSFPGSTDGLDASISPGGQT